MATGTYEPIMTSTISAGATSITLSSIPNTYTDLRLVINYSFGSSYGGYNAAMYVNGGNATHSITEFGGNGSSASVGRQSGGTQWLMTFPTGSPTTPGTGVILADFINYADTSVYKTALIRHNVPASVAPGLQQSVVLYQSNTAINSITLIGNSGSQLAEGTLSLYGIKAA